VIGRIRSLHRQARDRQRSWELRQCSASEAAQVALPFPIPYPGIASFILMRRDPAHSLGGKNCAQIEYKALLLIYFFAFFDLVIQ
jgi:hypothetical protein